MTTQSEPVVGYLITVHPDRRVEGTIFYQLDDYDDALGMALGGSVMRILEMKDILLPDHLIKLLDPEIATFLGEAPRACLAYQAYPKKGEVNYHGNALVSGAIWRHRDNPQAQIDDPLLDEKVLGPLVILTGTNAWMALL